MYPHFRFWAYRCFLFPFCLTIWTLGIAVSSAALPAAPRAVPDTGGVCIVSAALSAAPRAVPETGDVIIVFADFSVSDFTFLSPPRAAPERGSASVVSTIVMASSCGSLSPPRAAPETGGVGLVFSSVPHVSARLALDWTIRGSVGRCPLRCLAKAVQSSASKPHTLQHSCFGTMRGWGRAVFSLMHLPCFHDRSMWSREPFLLEKHVPHMMHWFVGHNLESHVRYP